MDPDTRRTVRSERDLARSANVAALKNLIGESANNPPAKLFREKAFLATYYVLNTSTSDMLT